MYLREILRKQIISRDEEREKQRQYQLVRLAGQDFDFFNVFKISGGLGKQRIQKRDKKETYILDIRDCRQAWRMTPAFFCCQRQRKGDGGVCRERGPCLQQNKETALNKEDFGFFAVDSSVSKADPAVFETSFCSYKNIPRFSGGYFLLFYLLPAMRSRVILLRT